jgi:hypothetical protein
MITVGHGEVLSGIASVKSLNGPPIAAPVRFIRSGLGITIIKVDTVELREPHS